MPGSPSEQSGRLLGRVALVTGGTQGLGAGIALPHLRAAGEGRIVIVGHRYGESVNEGIAACNAAALFLLSDWARFINGEVLHAGGGQHVAGPVINPIKFQGKSMPASPANQ